MVSVNLVANTDLRTPEEFRQLVVKEQNGVVVRLGEIADVVLGAENYEEDVRFDGETAVFMGIWVLPTANSLEVVERVRAEVPDIQAQLPAGMKVGIPYDATAYIEDAIHEVLRTLTETLLIVVLVIFLFLGSVRAVIIPVVAIPISLIGAVFLMLAAGFTINLLTLLAIVLAVGLVVDDAIVMVENVERHLHAGMAPVQAALTAARELVGPIIAMTITLAAVYAPVGIQGGLTGALFREFAFTLAGAVIVSGVVALTLSPMMGASLLRTGDSERGFAGWINRRFDSVRRVYASVLTSTLRYRPVVLVLWAIVAVLTVPFYLLSQRELAPAEDQGVVFSIIQAAPNSTIDQTTLFTQQVHDVYRKIPEAKSIFQLTSPTGGFGGFVAKPWSERTKTTQQLLMEVAGPLSQIPGHPRHPADPAAAAGRRRLPRRHGHLDGRRPGAARRDRAAAGREGVRQRHVPLRRRRPEVRPAADRGRVRPRQAAVAGHRPQAGRTGSLDAARRQLRQPLQHPGPQLQGDPAGEADGAAHGGSAQRDVRRPDPDNDARAAVDVRRAEDHGAAARAEEVPAAQLRAHPGRDPAGRPARRGAVVPRDRRRARCCRRAPRSTSPANRASCARKAAASSARLLLSAVLIYLVLAAQFESFRDPFIILAGSVPLAVAGALLFSFLGFTSLNIYSQVGLITLVGLVAKNGILIVEFANHLQESGKAKLQAILEASETRLRPILMTTAATVVGHFPLVIATGPGAGARNSIGVMLVSGMIIGTLFTLFVVPSIYMLLARTRVAEPAAVEAGRSESRRRRAWRRRCRCRPPASHA